MSITNEKREAVRPRSGHREHWAVDDDRVSAYGEYQLAPIAKARFTPSREDGVSKSGHASPLVDPPGHLRCRRLWTALAFPPHGSTSSVSRPGATGSCPDGVAVAEE